MEHADALSDEDCWQAVGEAWDDSDRQGIPMREWRRLWCSARPGREAVMTETALARLASLPERVTVYRGVWSVIHEGVGLVKVGVRVLSKLGAGSLTAYRSRKCSSHPFGRAGRTRVSCGARGLNQVGGRPG